MTAVLGMEFPLTIAPVGLMTPTNKTFEMLILVVFFERRTSDMIEKLAYLALAGGLGTLLRYGLAGFIQRLDGASFPWGTLAVNLIGCFLAGLLWVLFANRWSVSGETRTIVLVGFMGAFTTFSSMIFETGQLFGSGEWLYATIHITMQNVLGLVALVAGMGLARLF